MSSYKLHYFDFRGRGEILRLLFAYAGQQYEDIRIPRPSWDSVKQNYLFDKLPILEIDGKPYGQSMALAGYLARQFGIHGKTDKEILEVEQVLGICGDLLAAFVVGHLEKDPERKAAIVKDNKERLYPRFVRFFETVLKNNKTGFYVGDKMGLADIAAFDTLDIRVDDSILQGFPLVKANLEKVRANQRIAQWLAKRPPAHH